MLRIDITRRLALSVPAVGSTLVLICTFWFLGQGTHSIARGIGRQEEPQKQQSGTALPDVIPLMYWPMDDTHRTITSYPHSPWTWEKLDLNPGMRCPPFGEREHTTTVARQHWRDPSKDEELDRQMAVPGQPRSENVGCYVSDSTTDNPDHEGTDIYAEINTPVFAVASGTVYSLGNGCGGDCTITVDHQATVGDTTYSFRVRYVHVNNVYHVGVGDEVQPGDHIGFIGNLSHLHLEVEGLEGCYGTCIINPWGKGSRDATGWHGYESYLWIDRDGDTLPDVANQETCVNGAGFNAQSAYPTVVAGESFEIYFEVVNTGTCTWTPGDGYALEHQQGERFGAASVPLSSPVQPGQTARFQLAMEAPTNVQPGETFQTWWQPARNGIPFGDAMWIQVTIGATQSGGQNYSYEAEPGGFVCGTTGPSPNIMGMHLRERDSQHEIEVEIEKCDGDDFRLGGKVYLDVDGVQTWGPIYYSDGASDIEFDIDPVDEGIFGAHEYRARVYSDDQPTIPKHTGTIIAYEEYDAGTENPTDMRFEPVETTPQCGTTGPSPNIIQLALETVDAGTSLRALVSKCDGTEFATDGQFYLLVDGNLRWGAVRAYDNRDVQEFVFSPAALGLQGEHDYMVWYYSEDQPTIPKHTGTVSAREQLAPNQIFVDVPPGYWAFDEISELYASSLTKGETTCRPEGDDRLYFCPDMALDRAHLTVFLLRRLYGPDYVPSGTYEGVFSDVPANHAQALWIEEAYREGLTNGSNQCPGSGLRFCPEMAATRDHIARFLSRTEEWTLPTPEGIFSDLDTSDAGLTGAAEYMWWQGYTNGATECDGEGLRYCPDIGLDRAHTAVFLTRVFGFVPTDSRCVSLAWHTDPPAAGTVTATPSANCPLTDIHLASTSAAGTLYREGTRVDLNVTANEGYRFDGWSGTLYAAPERPSMRLSSNEVAMATFTKLDGKSPTPDPDPTSEPEQTPSPEPTEPGTQPNALFMPLLQSE